jgi:3-oxoacyl-(acyl-carrier-protein) synthase
MILSEGAGAVLIGRAGPITIEATQVVGHCRTRAETEGVIKQILYDLSQAKIDFVISSANGTFIDKAEFGAVLAIIPNAFVYTAKPALGESVGAAGLWQVILGSQALRCGELPPLLHAGATIPLRTSASRIPVAGARHTIVLSCGVNQQVAGLRLSIR